jgi:hypothetical protein
MYLDGGKCVTCNLGKWSSILWSSDKELHRSCGERKRKENNQVKLATDMKTNSKNVIFSYFSGILIVKPEAVCKEGDKCRIPSIFLYMNF